MMRNRTYLPKQPAVQTNLYTTSTSLVSNILFILVLGLCPAYIFPSGGFQVVDIPLVFLISWTLLSYYKTDISFRQVYQLIPFVVWGCLVNISYLVFASDINYYKGIIQIVYGITIFYSFIIFYKKLLDAKNGIFVVYCGIFLSLMVTFTVKGVSEEVGRVILSFNDPNQLGYFGVILLGYVILIMRYKASKNYHNIYYSIFDAVIIFFAHFYLALSVSRTAMAAFAVLDLCLLKNLREIKLILPLSLCATIVFIFLAFWRPNFIQERLEVRPQEVYSENVMVESFKTRALHPLYSLNMYEFIVGRGQGGSPFKKGTLAGFGEKAGSLMESHNLFFEIIRGYGIIGLGLFFYWLGHILWATRALKDAPWVWAGLLTFNMGIYGLRWRAFWILVAFIVALVAYQKALNRAVDTQPIPAHPPGARVAG